MADVFLSYSTEDLPRVRPLIAALEERGLSVWWDKKIPPGKSYTQVIRENLNAAHVVLVVWSKHSVNSDWVQIEATKGKARGILVPALIDSVVDDIPWEFSLIEAANLVQWQGDTEDEEFEELIRSLAAHRGAPTTRSQLPSAHEADELEPARKTRARVTPRPPSPSTRRALPPREQFINDLKQRGWGVGDPYLSEASPNIFYADNHPHKRPRIVIRGTRVRVERRNSDTGAYALSQSFSLEHERDAALKAIDRLGPPKKLFYYYGGPPDA